MAGLRRAIELAIGEEDLAALRGYCPLANGAGEPGRASAEADQSAHNFARNFCGNDRRQQLLSAHMDLIRYAANFDHAVTTWEDKHDPLERPHYIFPFIGAAFSRARRFSAPPGRSPRS